METTRVAWQHFEDLVRRILEANDFRINVHSPRGDVGFDFLGIRGDERWAIEVKYYRTTRAQPGLVEAAAIRVAKHGPEAKATNGMLVVSCLLPTSLRFTLEKRYGITFADRVDLREWAMSMPALADELDSLLEVDTEDLKRPGSERIP